MPSAPLRSRDWFQDAYIRCAALVMKGVMFQTTPPESVSVIEGQLERAYRRGRADEKREARGAARA